MATTKQKKDDASIEAAAVADTHHTRHNLFNVVTEQLAQGAEAIKLDPDIAAIVALSMLLPMAGNLIVALSIDRVRATLPSAPARRRIDRIAGGLMIGAGIVIAFG